MSEDVRKYFTTDEFAKLCHVKKQTLFHYDEIGLLFSDFPAGFAPSYTENKEQKRIMGTGTLKVQYPDSWGFVN